MGGRNAAAVERIDDIELHQRGFEMRKLMAATLLVLAASAMAACKKGGGGGYIQSAPTPVVAR